jgi:hypothetical protein
VELHESSPYLTLFSEDERQNEASNKPRGDCRRRHIQGNTYDKPAGDACWNPVKRQAVGKGVCACTKEREPADENAGDTEELANVTKIVRDSHETEDAESNEESTDQPEYGLPFHVTRL